MNWEIMLATLKESREAERVFYWLKRFENDLSVYQMLLGLSIYNLKMQNKRVKKHQTVTALSFIYCFKLLTFRAAGILSSH